MYLNFENFDKGLALNISDREGHRERGWGGGGGGGRGRLTNRLICSETETYRITLRQ